MDCLTCTYCKDGMCYWFQEPKKIPEKIINKGCNQLINKSLHPLLNDAIVLFNGRIL